MIASALARRRLTFMQDETTDDPVIADKRNFYKVELWTRGDQIERMLFAGTSLD
jgi:hypothetical protein